MTIDTTYLDSGADKIKLARPAILAMAQEINRLPIRPESFGAIGDGNFSAATGTDDSAALAACLSQAYSTGRPILLQSVYRIADADVLVLADAVRIYGNGPDTGIIVETDSTQTAVWIKSAVHLSDFRIHCAPTAAKAADTGHLQACVTIGDGFFLNRDHVEVSDWRVERMRLTRKAGYGGGFAVSGIGNVSNGYVGEIDDIGSGEDHSGLVQFHWAPRTATGTVGEVPTKTYHPRHIRIGALYAENSFRTLNLSACFDVVQEGQFTNIGGSQLFYFLPGDEINTYQQHGNADLICKGIKVLGPLFGRSLADDTEPVIDLFSVGTSKISTMPDDVGILLQKAIDCEVTIGDVTVVGSANASKYLLNVFKYYGSLRVGKITGIDCGPAVRGVSISNSIGNIIIDDLIGDFKTDALYIANSSGVTLRGSKVAVSDQVDSGDRVAYSFGSTFSAGTASGAHAQYATKLTLSAGLSSSVMPGWPVCVGAAVAVTAGGTGYTNGETVNIAGADGNGNGATGTVTVSGGAVTSVTMKTTGAGFYNTKPVTITAADGSGTGATGTISVGDIVTATAFAPTGATALYVTAIPTALAGGEALTVDAQNYKLDLTLRTSGGYLGMDCAGSFGVIRGNFEHAFLTGARFRNASIIDLVGVDFSGNGRGRQATPALATADIQVTNTAARVKMIGGSCGRDGRLTEYNIRCSTSEGIWQRFIGVGVTFAGNVTSHITASTASNYELIGCTDKAGNLI